MCVSIHACPCVEVIGQLAVVVSLFPPWHCEDRIQLSDLVLGPLSAEPCWPRISFEGLLFAVVSVQQWAIELTGLGCLVVVSGVVCLFCLGVWFVCFFSFVLACLDFQWFFNLCLENVSCGLFWPHFFFLVFIDFQISHILNSTVFSLWKHAFIFLSISFILCISFDLFSGSRCIPPSPPTGIKAHPLSS